MVATRTVGPLSEEPATLDTVTVLYCPSLNGEIGVRYSMFFSPAAAAAAAVVGIVRLLLHRLGGFGVRLLKGSSTR